MSDPSSDFPPISLVVPHRGPMVLLDRIVDWAPGRIECALRVEDGARFVEDGRLAAPFTIEHMAQAVAACLGYEAYRGGRGVRVGMIVACREFEAFRPAASVGDDLRVRADRERGNETLSHFHCQVSNHDDAFATAILTLFHGEKLVQRPS
jgi:predicted hotdog family 3-hydroxylacyl-ACP dehydratase